MSLLISTVRRSGGALAPVFTSSPAISGTYSIGSVLTCAPGAWTGTAPVTPSYQWLRDGVAIGGATASTYTLVSADMIGTVTCAVTITNSAGFDVDASNGLSWSDYVLPLAPKVWLNARGLAAGLLSAWPDLSGLGNGPTASGGLRPTASSDEVVFAGAQRMTTPAFSMGAQASGFVVCRASADSQGIFQFAGLNGHHSVLSTGGELRIRRMGGGREMVTARTGSQQIAVYAMAAAFGSEEALWDGVAATENAGSPTPMSPVTDVLSLGDLTGGIWPLVGGIREIAIFGSVLNSTQVAQIAAALAARWP